MRAGHACTAAVCVLLFVAACSPSAGDPRGAVVKFLRAVRNSDTLAILRGITVEAPYTLIPDTGLTVAGPRADTIMVARLLAELSPGGAIHLRWQEQRLVVGNADPRPGDSALVEVTRLDQRQGHRIYNKFGLVNRGGYWQIYSFKTQPGPSL
jgi:hypothetical protein